jgi:biotin-(acetyl-CoA carboxylase) ligase
MASGDANLHHESNERFDYPAGSILKSEMNVDLKLLCEKICDYVHKSRLTPQEISDQWTSKCIHLNKTVELIEGDQTIKGVFTGIGQNGEALIQTDNEVKSFYNGTLRY